MSTTIAMRRVLLLALPALLAAGCTTMPRTTTQRRELRNDASEALAEMSARDSQLQPLLDRAAGYAIFPNCGKAGLLLGGSFGHGTVYDREGNLEGYARISQASVGGTIGARLYSLLLVFQTSDDLSRFENGQPLSFGAEATAIAISEGSSATSRFNNGLAVFAMPRGGLMADASLSGQSFAFEKRPAADDAAAGAIRDSESAELPEN